MRHLPLAGLLAGALLLGAGCQRKPGVEGGSPPGETGSAAGVAAPSPAPGATGAGGPLPPDQTTPAEGAEAEAAAAAAGLPPVPFTRAAFACTDGQDIEVRFFPDQGIAVLIRDGVSRELQAEPVASGFRYAGQEVAIRGKGTTLDLTLAGTTVACQQKERG